MLGYESRANLNALLSHFMISLIKVWRFVSIWISSQPYQNSPALFFAEPVPHEGDGRQYVSRQVQASEPDLAVDEEGDHKHQVDDFAHQEEDAPDKHQLPAGTMKH